MARTRLTMAAVAAALFVGSEISAAPDAASVGLRGETTTRQLATLRFCSFIGCPAGSIPIPEAWATECSDGICTEEQCCDSFCWGIACPNGFILDPITIDLECGRTDEGCTTDFCCLDYNDDDENEEGPFCNSIGCPNGAVPIPDADEIECCAGVCLDVDCCDSFCSAHPCPNSFTPIPYANETLCPDLVCSDALCCEALCSGFACPNNFIPIYDASKVRCTNDECTAEECCTEVNW